MYLPNLTVSLIWFEVLHFFRKNKKKNIKVNSASFNIYSLINNIYIHIYSIYDIMVIIFKIVHYGILKWYLK